jgi:PAS domain S-box-containing protein
MQTSPADTALTSDETARLRERVAELERALAQRAEERRSQEALAFLAEASAILASSLDYEETLAHLAQIAVPHIADWCAVDLKTRDGSTQRLAVAHVDQAKLALAHEIYRRWPMRPDDPAGVPNVIRTGTPEVAPVITEQMIREGIADPELRAIFLDIGLSSMMIVPLKARGRTLGAITLASAESGRHFTADDLRLAEDVAHRAAVAIENAELYRELRQFRGTLDRTSDCVFMFDAETLRFFYINQGAVEQVGYSADELMAMTPLDIKPAFTYEQFATMIAPLVSGAAPVLNFETVHRHKDGHDVPVEIALQYVNPPDGDPRFVAVVRDITERKRVQNELARQAATLASQKRLIDLAHEAILVRDEGGRITHWNRGAAELYGYSAEQAVGRISHELLKTHLADSDIPIAPTQDYILGATGSWEGELVHTRRDGRRIVVESRQVSVADESGQRTQILEINRDITARKEAEAALRESEQRFRDLADAMPLVVWTAGADGMVTYFNRRWYEFSGMQVAASLGDGWGVVIHPDDLQRTIDCWESARRTESQYEIEYRWRHADGGYRWWLGRALPVRDEAGRISYWVGTGTDIDEQKRAEDQLRDQAASLAQLTHQLEERNRELDQFAYITSHDLKAPLRGMANLAQWIEEDLGDTVTPEIRQQFELLKGRAHRMEALIDGILQYSRVGRLGEDPQPVDVGLLLTDVIDLLAPPPNTVTVEGHMPTLTTARVPLQQVFHNLIGNALKHGGPAVRVRVSCAEEGGGYAFTVADDGPGIAPQFHQRIFGIFQTLASRDRVEGSGLGLALVKKIVEHRGGRVSVLSAEGQGAAFTFTWPRTSAKAQTRR